MSQTISLDRDGFQILAGEFTFPIDTWNLDPRTKRDVTICNLFFNHQYSISEVARVLDEERTNVIQVLLKKGIMQLPHHRTYRTTKGPASSMVNILDSGSPYKG